MVFLHYDITKKNIFFIKNKTIYSDERFSFKLLIVLLGQKVSSGAISLTTPLILFEPDASSQTNQPILVSQKMAHFDFGS